MRDEQAEEEENAGLDSAREERRTSRRNTDKWEKLECVRYDGMRLRE